MDLQSTRAALTLSVVSTCMRIPQFSSNNYNLHAEYTRSSNSTHFIAGNTEIASPPRPLEQKKKKKEKKGDLIKMQRKQKQSYIVQSN